MVTSHCQDGPSCVARMDFIEKVSYEQVIKGSGVVSHDEI